VEKQPATLLRVRFGDLPQLQNHLHVVDGRTVFFFREAAARLQGADRVVVEFSVATSEQVSTLRGTVLGRGEGGQVGAWIEFPDAKLAKRVERGAEALATRQHQRVMCDLTVEVKQGRQPFLARMMDVSMGGARSWGRPPSAWVRCRCGPGRPSVCASSERKLPFPRTSAAPTWCAST